jgi:osmotically-inducible protein OsmY
LVSYSAHVLQRDFVIGQLLSDWQSPQRGRKREKLQNMSKLLNHLDKRASADLKRRITSFLAQRGVNSVHRLNIEVNGGIVTLHGMVYSFYERQLCISCCQRIAGVVRFIDNLTVALPPSR